MKTEIDGNVKLGCSYLFIDTYSWSPPILFFGLLLHILLWSLIWAWCMTIQHIFRTHGSLYCRKCVYFSSPFHTGDRPNILTVRHFMLMIHDVYILILKVEDRHDFVVTFFFPFTSYQRFGFVWPYFFVPADLLKRDRPDQREKKWKKVCNWFDSSEFWEKCHLCVELMSTTLS